MKKILIGLYKKYAGIFLVEIIFLIANVYLIAMPSRIVGNIINYLYDIEANKSLIFAEIARLMSILRFVYYCKNGLEKYRGQDGICFRKAYKRYYVCEVS